MDKMKQVFAVVLVISAVLLGGCGTDGMAPSDRDRSGRGGHQH